MKHLFIVCLLLICIFACKQSSRPSVISREEASGIMDEVRGRNMAYIPLTERDDSLMRRALVYYEEHGTSNELMEAYYLSGSAYRDLHEAPKALEAFLNGINAADLADENCRYDILARLYGQKSDIMYLQGIYNQAIEDNKNCYKYALLAKDTLFMVTAKWWNLGGHYALSDYKTIANECWDLLEESKRMGVYAYGTRWLCTCVLANIELGRVTDAAKLLSIYEQHSGQVNTKTHESSFPIYYYAKGRVLAALGKLDSAEFFYRKELTEDADWNNRQAAYRGLRLLFEQKGQMDSVCKYAPLQCDAVDSSYQEKLSKNLQNLNEMYDYTRLQKENDQKELLLQENRRKALYLWSFLVVAIVSTVFFFFYLHLWYKQRIASVELELERANANLGEQENNLEMLREELARTKDEAESISLKEKIEKAEKETEDTRVQVLNWSGKLDELRRHVRTNSKTLRQRYCTTSSFQTLLDKARNNGTATKEDYEQVKALLSERDATLLHRFSKLLPNYSETEMHCFLLLRLGLTKTEVGILTAHSQAAVTNTCTRLFQKAHGWKCSTSAEAYEWLLMI